MLAELAIRNFAIIDELQLQFDNGMNALTGETGAGKSIIIDALGAVLGERVGSEVVRTGAAAATTEAVFDLTGRDASEIAARGRSSARINGRPVTVGALNQLGALLIDIHGQSDHHKLLQSSAQLDAL